MEANDSPAPSGNGQRHAGGAPRGNQNAVKHGLHGLIAARKRGKVDRRTSFGRAFEAGKKEYIAHLGGDQLSAMELVLIVDTVWSDFYIAAYDAYLASLKSVIRKGRPHPIIDARTRLAAHRRENLKTLGLKRVAKELSGYEAIAARYGSAKGETP